MSLDNVFLSIFISIHNRLETMVYNIINAYPEAMMQDKVYAVVEEEFGS